MNEEEYYSIERERMVTDQLISRDIYDERVLNAMRIIPRHYFVPMEYRHLAYSDGPLPIDESQTISQPYIVALMTQLLFLTGKEKVLEIGTGSGYQAAILAQLAPIVHTIERFKSLAERAQKVFKQLGLQNVQVHVGDGTLGWINDAPYDGIIVTAAAPKVPHPIMEQLAENGRVVLPVGSRGNQLLERWIRHGTNFIHEEIAPVAFVPLIGQYGWQMDEWEWR